MTIKPMIAFLTLVKDETKYPYEEARQLFF